MVQRQRYLRANIPIDAGITSLMIRSNINFYLNSLNIIKTHPKVHIIIITIN